MKNEILVGVISVKYDKNDLFLDRIEISTNSQGKGIGNYFLSTLQKKADLEGKWGIWKPLYIGVFIGTKTSLIKLEIRRSR